jgi:hypothetical protein
MKSFATVLTATLMALAGVAVGARPVAADGQALIRVAYLSPDAASADAYVDGVKTLSSVSYKTVSTYSGIAPGSHTIDIRAAGSAAGSTPWAEVSHGLSANAYYTVLVGGRFGQLQAAVFQDGFTAPGPGQAEARFVHMAPDVPAVDVAVKGGPVIFSNISFLHASDYTALPSGSYDLELRATGTSTVLFSAAGVVANGGTIHSLTGIGGVGNPVELLQILDATAPSGTPVGGASTGGGGTAAGAPLSPTPMGLALIAIAGLMVAWSRVTRRRAT